MLQSLRIIFLVFQCVHGFLIESTTTKNVLVITDTHYITLIDMLTEERQARHQLEQVVTTLQQKVQSLEQKDISQQITSVERELRENTKNDTAIRQLAEALDKKIANLEANQTFLGNQLLTITKNNHPVALTAWNAEGNITIGKVIKFNRVKTSTGVSSLYTINSMGFFTTEVDGLYIIAVTVNSGTNDSGFEIHKNSITLSKVYIQGDVGRNDQSGTSVVSTELKKGDLISVKASSGNRDNGIVFVEGAGQHCPSLKFNSLKKLLNFT